MRVSKETVGREGANLGGVQIVDAIRSSMGRGCYGSGGLSYEGWWPSEMVVSLWSDRFLVRVRYRRRLAFRAGASSASPNAGQTSDEVPIFAVVDAANRLHTGH